MFFYAACVAFLLVAQGTKPSPKAAGPMDSCYNQANCMSLTFTELPGTSSCESGSCLWSVCLKFNYGPNCVKTGSISHTCQKSSAACSSPSPDTFVGAAEISSWGASNEQQCQIAKAGSVITFLLKDGEGCKAGGALATWPFDGMPSGASVACAPRNFAGSGYSFSNVNSCTGNGDQVECIWKVQVPACTAKPPPVVTETGTLACNCQNGASCDAKGNCVCPPGYTGSLCETLVCTSIVANYPDMKVLNSGFGPKCTLDEAAADLGGYDCVPQAPGCNVLKCNQPVPAEIMAGIASRCINN